MRLLCVSSALSQPSRSEALARRCADELKQLGAEVDFVSLRDPAYALPPFDNVSYDTPAMLRLHELTEAADGLVLASPIYNWDVCSELKKYIEWIGSTPPDGLRRGALFDKVVALVAAAGLPHSYMGPASFAQSLALDFKCIASPYQAYVHDRHWQEGQLIAEAETRLKKAMTVFHELATLLKARQYRSGWEI